MPQPHTSPTTYHTCPPPCTPPAMHVPCHTRPRRYGQWAGSTHPTGMHSCSHMIFEDCMMPPFPLYWMFTEVYLIAFCCTIRISCQLKFRSCSKLELHSNHWFVAFGQIETTRQLSFIQNQSLWARLIWKYVNSATYDDVNGDRNLENSD